MKNKVNPKHYSLENTELTFFPNVKILLSLN